jgi:hypothetical protein
MQKCSRTRSPKKWLISSGPKICVVPISGKSGGLQRNNFRVRKVSNEVSDLGPIRGPLGQVSVPSRFYNLLAVGRPVIVAAEPDSEAALLAQEEDVGWVVSPEDAAQLALTIRQTALDRAGTMQKANARQNWPRNMVRALH